MITDFDKDGTWYGFPGEAIDFWRGDTKIHLPGITYRPSHDVRWSVTNDLYRIATLWILARLPDGHGSTKMHHLTRAVSVEALALTIDTDRFMDYFIRAAFRDWETFIGGQWLTIDGVAKGENL